MDIRKHGRYGDTELVHMSVEEVRALDGLAALAGTRLTTNPATGYPEAFSLKSLLPTILGVGASMIGGPMLGAAVAGGIEGVKSGDPLRGLAAGALSAGMGSALGGLGSTGGAAAADVGAQAAADAAASSATQLGQQAITDPNMIAAGIGLPAPEALGAVAPPVTMDPNIMAAQTGMALPNAGQAAMPQAMAAGQQAAAPPAFGEQAGNWMRGRVQQQYPGWSSERLMNNIGEGNFDGISGGAKMGMGLGGLGMAGYWSQDMAKAREAEQEAGTAEERKRVQDRYDYYSDLARRVNSGQVAPPTFLPRYPGRS